jgi:hypothetical protein
MTRAAPLVPWMIAAALLPAGITACAPEDARPDEEGRRGFDAHTVRTIDSPAAFEALAAEGAGSSAVKLVVTRFPTPARNVRFLDAGHYRLHDEWYWFNLLNGAALDGVDTAPVDVGRRFGTIEEIVAWARSRAVLPLDLRFVGDGRLYSPRFYTLALSTEPKQLGVATLLRFPARPLPEGGTRPERWAFELEHGHVLTEAELSAFFEVLEPALPFLSPPPTDVGSDDDAALRFLVRSPQQESLAQALEAAGSPLAARVLRFVDVTSPGETEVYAEGVTAGRLRVVSSEAAATGALDETSSADVLVLEDVPDFLPACAGLLTAAPQTALAHVSLLARNRGIPNGYRQGLLDDPQIDALARARAPVAVRTRAPDRLEIVALTEAQYAQYRQLATARVDPLPPVDVAALDVTYDLAALSFTEAVASGLPADVSWRGALGGKSVGFLALLEAEDVTTPPRPLGVSIRPYSEHVEPLRPGLSAMLADDAFRADAHVRLLVLEGAAAYRARHPEDASFPERFVAARPRGDPLRAFVEDEAGGGGVTGAIRSLPIAGATRDALRDALEAHFGAYADAQGLRFRSSSNVEDAEGFNGAGLYASSTGYLRPTRAGDATVEDALRDVWASYWGVEAFEERASAGVEHLDGAMGVTVHASFPDRLERANGVLTFTLLPPGHVAGRAVLEVNVQRGALSVTNPPPGDPSLPEVDRVVLPHLIAHSTQGWGRDPRTKAGAADPNTPTIERLRRSTRSPDADLLSDAELLDLFDQAGRVTRLWLDAENEGLSAPQRRRTLTLDFELRAVAEGWPALRNGATFGPRLVLKQARTLEPGLARVPPDVRATLKAMPFPRDVLARARRVVQTTCTAASLRVVATEAYTDPTKPPDLGFEAAPFTAFVAVVFREDVPELNATAGETRAALHTAYGAAHPGLAEGGPWSIDVDIRADRQEDLGLTAIAFAPAVGALTVDTPEGAVTAGATCTDAILYAAPEDFLTALLDGP